MSELFKQLKKKELEKQQQQQQQQLDEEDEGDLEEEEDELKDQIQTIPFQQLHIHQTGGPIKITQSFQLPPQKQNQQAQTTNKKIFDYTPLHWNQFYDSQEFMENGTPIYRAGNEGIIFLCLHGAGDSASSFCQLAHEIKQFSSLVSFDFRGHGESKVTENLEDLSQETLIKDTNDVYEWCLKKWPTQNFIIVGHSMGGSIASKFVEKYESVHPGKIQGLVVIDVVEGTALEALPFMVNLVQNRPQQFETLESLIQWSMKSQTLRNLQSARVSMPSKVIKNEQGKYVWRVNLLKSEKYWTGWFQGLTQSFLNIRVAKLLMTAEKERMDKDLTIAQMQGKFRLVVLHGVGHYMMEDDFKGTAFQFHQLLCAFKVAKNQQEMDDLKTVGIGKFHPQVLPYQK